MRGIMGRSTLALAASLGACDWDLQRMMEQERCAPLERTELLPGGWCDRSAPEGTLVYQVAGEPRQSAHGSADDQGVDARGAPVARIPIVLDRSALERGRDRFERFCAPCHGVLGNGHSPVAENMELRKPPSFAEEDIAGSPDGQIFQVITHGFGLMPSYAHVLPPEDRWAVVGYVRALALSQSARMDELPEPLRRKAAPWLK